MSVTLSVVTGPQAGQEFRFDRRDSFLVGRASDCHFCINYADPYIVDRHVLFEINSPRCRVIDLKSRSGIKINGKKAEQAELNDGDEVRAGQTVLRVAITPGDEVPLKFQPPQPVVGLDGAVKLPEIPDLRLDKEIGRGGIGVVYRTAKDSYGRRLAIKTVHVDPGAAAKDIDSFLRATRELEQLDHANMVHYIGNGNVGPMIWLAMEHVNGPSAEQFVRQRGPMAVRMGVLVVCQAMHGLILAHQQGYVHHAVRPANLLIATQGDKRLIKIADVGLNRAFESSKLSGQSLVGDLSSAIAFLAPEQITHFRSAKASADQYAIAATLYWMITQKYPHDLPDNRLRALATIVTEAPIPVRQRREEIPEAIANLIDRGLARLPENRFKSMGEFTELLQAALEAWPE